MSLFVHLFYYLFFAQCCFWTLQHRKKEKKLALRGRLSAQCPLLHLEVSQAATPAAPQCVCVSAVAVTNVCVFEWLNWNLTAFCWIKGSVPFERCCSDKRGVFPGSSLPHRAFTCCNRHKIRYSHALFLLTSLHAVKCQ